MSAMTDGPARQIKPSHAALATNQSLVSPRTQFIFYSLMREE